MNKFLIGTLADNLSDDPAAFSAYMNKHWLPWNTFSKIPVGCKDFIMSFESDTMPGYTNYKNRLDLFEDASFPTNMINSFPDIANPTKDIITAGVQGLLVNSSAELSDASFNILKDYYAIQLIANYYSNPICEALAADPGKRLQTAQQISFANYTQRLNLWNTNASQPHKNWITSTLGSILSVIPYVGSTLAEVIGNIGNSTKGINLTTPNGNTFSLNKSGLAADLTGGTSLTTILLIGAGLGLLLMMTNKSKK